MSSGSRPSHNELIVDQFTKQAIPFSELAAHSDEAAMNQLIQLTHASPGDTMLDVACGPGLVALAFAPHVGQVTGIDLTPAMIERAKSLQQKRGVSNVSWQIGDVTHLPFADSSFSLVLTRYTFHHFTDPKAVIREMYRVCKPGGVIAVADAFTSDDPAQAQAFNEMEKLRDPSHVRALTLGELRALVQEAGVNDIRTAFYKVPAELEQALKASFPNPGDADRLRDIFQRDIGRNELGMGVHLQEGKIHYAYPIVVLVGRKQ